MMGWRQARNLLSLMSADEVKRGLICFPIIHDRSKFIVAELIGIARASRDRSRSDVECLTCTREMNSISAVTRRFIECFRPEASRLFTDARLLVKGEKAV